MKLANFNTDRGGSRHMAVTSERVIVVTGASRGIGRAIALRAAADGANIAIASKTDEPNPKLPGTIHTVADEIVAAGGRALPIAMDVRREEEIEAAGYNSYRREVSEQ